MRKQLTTLALQVVERQQLLSVAMIRIQHGFMPAENTLAASRHLHDIRQLIREIEESLKPKPVFKQVEMEK
jgi:hypothetical protein